MHDLNPDTTRRRGARSALWAVIFAGALLRIVPIWFGLPYLQARPDEETALGQALAVMGGDPNPHFFHWPSLTFYVFAGLFTAASWIRRAFSIAGPLSMEHYVLLARAFVALAGTLTLAVVYTIGRRMAGAAVGLLAALLLAVAILHVRESHFAMTDVLMTLLATASLAELLRALDTGPDAGGGSRVGAFARAGLAGGLATSAKYSAVAVVAAMAVAQVVVLIRDPRGFRLAPASLMPGVVFMAAFGFAFVAGTPYSILDYQHFVPDFRFNFSHLAGGHGIDLGRGWSYHAIRTLPYGAGILTCGAAIAGIVPFVRHYRAHALIIFGFAGTFYVSIGSGRTVFFRYALPLLPVICLAAAVGVRHVGGWLASRWRVPAPTAVGLLGALVIVPAAINCVWFDVLLARTDTRVLARQWLVAHARPGQTIYEAPDVYTLLDLRGMTLHSWRFDPATESFLDADGRVPDWLVLHESPLSGYARIPSELRALATRRYELAEAFRATSGRARSAVYDWQDAFFMPVSGFSTVTRPGPTIFIYRRVR